MDEFSGRPKLSNMHNMSIINSKQIFKYYSFLFFHISFFC